MKIYLYDKNTKCFIREKEAYVNPVKRTEFLLDKKFGDYAERIIYYAYFYSQLPKKRDIHREKSH